LRNQMNNYKLYIKLSNSYCQTVYQFLVIE